MNLERDHLEAFLPRLQAFVKDAASYFDISEEKAAQLLAGAMIGLIRVGLRMSREDIHKAADVAMDEAERACAAELLKEKTS